MPTTFCSLFGTAVKSDLRCPISVYFSAAAGTTLQLSVPFHPQPSPIGSVSIQSSLVAIGTTQLSTPFQPQPSALSSTHSPATGDRLVDESTTQVMSFSNPNPSPSTSRLICEQEGSWLCARMSVDAAHANNIKEDKINRTVYMLGSRDITS